MEDKKPLNPMMGFVFAFAFFFIVFIGAIFIGGISNDKAKESPIWRIDYLDSNGNVKYSRYSSYLNYQRGVLNYTDFYNKSRVSTSETTETVRLR